jgi:hypothetical protein
MFVSNVSLSAILSKHPVSSREIGFSDELLSVVVNRNVLVPYGAYF